MPDDPVAEVERIIVALNNVPAGLQPAMTAKEATGLLKQIHEGAKDVGDRRAAARTEIVEAAKHFAGIIVAFVLILLCFAYCPAASRYDLIKSLVPLIAGFAGYGVGKLKKQ